LNGNDRVRLYTVLANDRVQSALKCLLLVGGGFDNEKVLVEPIPADNRNDYGDAPFCHAVPTAPPESDEPQRDGQKQRERDTIIVISVSCDILLG